MDKDEQERRNIVSGAKSHIKSILTALRKYKKGSNVEREYAIEHADKLRTYYLEKL